jgi:4-oxalmesaconate hydratase
LIIDTHAHTVSNRKAPTYGALMGRWTTLEAAGTYGGRPRLPDEEELIAGVQRQLELMDAVGTDIQLTSPRPFVLKHSHKPGQIVHWWCALNNDVIALQARHYPERVKGIAGLPQVSGAPVTDIMEELHRCIDDLGFVGVLLNPDPSEGAGTAPTLDDEYWYPLYEELSKRDVPALIHSAGCYGRESYSEHFISEESLAINSMIRGRVFSTFPSLKIIVPHGGGSIPYQLGRWVAHQRVSRPGEPFEDDLKRFWFDTTLYTRGALALLIDTVGPDRVLFGTERPGSGHELEDLKPVIESLDGLKPTDLELIFEGNARKVFSRLS